MSKELIKDAIGINPGGHEYDMRPRYDADTYIALLNMAKRLDMKPNVLLRVITKLQLKNMEDESWEQTAASIMRIQNNN